MLEEFNSVNQTLLPFLKKSFSPKDFQIKDKFSGNSAVQQECRNKNG